MCVRFARSVAKALTTVICVGLLVMGGCGKAIEAPGADAQVTRPAPFAVELVNAKVWRRAGPPLFSDDKRPRIILPAQIEGVRAFVGTQAATLTPHPTSDGHQAYELRFEPPEGTFELRVEDALGRRLAWSAAWIGPEVEAALAQVGALVDEARRLSRAGDPTAEAVRARAARRADQHGLTSVAATHWRAVAYMARQRTDLAALDAALDEAARLLVPADRIGHMGLELHRGTAARLAGDMRTANACLKRTATAARRLGRLDYAYAAQTALGNVQVKQGQIGAALEIYAQIEPREAHDASERQQEKRRIWHNNVAWALLSGMVGGSLPSELDIVHWHLEEALALTEPSAAQAEALSNLADTHRRAGDLRAALGVLALADDLDPGGLTNGASWRHIVAADVAFASGDLDRAEVGYHAVGALGPSSGDPDPEASWRAVAGLARLHARRGSRAAARALFEEAGRRVDALAGGVELASNSGTFYASRRFLFDDWARFLLSAPDLDQARLGDAWAVIEMSQSRAWRTRCSGPLDAARLTSRSARVAGSRPAPASRRPARRRGRSPRRSDRRGARAGTLRAPTSSVSCTR